MPAYVQKLQLWLLRGLHVHGIVVDGAPLIAVIKLRHGLVHGHAHFYAVCNHYNTWLDQSGSYHVDLQLSRAVQVTLTCSNVG